MAKVEVVGGKGPHPTISTSCRFATDQVLRRHGFEIVSRPGDSEPVWRKNGTTFPHSEALLRLPPGAMEEARRLEETYCREKYRG